MFILTLTYVIMDNLLSLFKMHFKYTKKNIVIDIHEDFDGTFS